MTTNRLDLTRAQVLAYRRNVGALDERLPPGPESLRRAAWAGLQDSMPRAALLSIHARVGDAGPFAWEDPSLVQLWGPRFSTYVVPAQDHWVFSLGRYPDSARGRRVAEETAASLQAVLGDRRMRDRDVAEALGVGNSIRYAGPTGTILIRWECARAPMIWAVPRPDVDPGAARLELARRYLHMFGPATPEAFATWAGIGAAAGRAAFGVLGEQLVAVRTPICDAWVLDEDEASFRAPIGATAPARLLPSGDAFFLLQGPDRELLLADPRDRDRLWTSRVWPGAVLVEGDVVGTWRRAGADLTIETFRPLQGPERAAVEAEAASLPLPGLTLPIRVRW